MNAAVLPALPPALLKQLAQDLLQAPPAAEVHLVCSPAEVRMNGTCGAATLHAGGRTLRLFLKAVDHGLGEAGVYRRMGPAGAPIAHLHADLRLEDGRELLVLEHLPRIGLAINEAAFAGEFATFIDSLADFNATPAPGLPVRTGALSGNLRLTREAWSRGRTGRWGESWVAAAAILDGRWPAIERLVEHLQSQLESLPLDACHQDPLFGNCGWRADGTLVLIDLSYASRHPGLLDLALVLGCCAQPWPGAAGRGPWIERYVDRYNRRSRHRLHQPGAGAGVLAHQQAAVFWLDERTLAAGEQRIQAEMAASGASGAGAWYARTWRRLLGMVDGDAEAATAP